MTKIGFVGLLALLFFVTFTGCAFAANEAQLNSVYVQYSDTNASQANISVGLLLAPGENSSSYAVQAQVGENPSMGTNDPWRQTINCTIFKYCIYVGANDDCSTRYRVTATMPNDWLEALNLYKNGKLLKTYRITNVLLGMGASVKTTGYTAELAEE